MILSLHENKSKRHIKIYTIHTKLIQKMNTLHNITTQKMKIFYFYYISFSNYTQNITYYMNLYIKIFRYDNKVSLHELYISAVGKVRNLLYIVQQLVTAEIFHLIHIYTSSYTHMHVNLFSCLIKCIYVYKIVKFCVFHE